MTPQNLPDPREQNIPDIGNLLKIAVFISLILALFIAAQAGGDIIGQYTRHASTPLGYARWLWIYAIGILTSMVVLGLGILGHDAVHKVLFSRPWMNEWLGGLVSALALLPFNANRQFHLAHHSYAHQPGRDPENPMHDRPLLIAMTAGSLIGLALQYRIMLNNLFTRSLDLRYARRVAQDLLLLAVAGAVYFLLVPALGFRLEVTVIPMLLTLPVVFGFRALSDHYGLPPLRREAVAGNPPTQTELDIWHQANAPVQHEVTGWVVLTHPFLEWLWSSVNYHEVHHKFPYLSHRHLKAAFDATRGQYPYAVVSGYARSLWLQRKRNYYAAQMPATGKDGMAV